MRLLRADGLAYPFPGAFKKKIMSEKNEIRATFEFLQEHQAALTAGQVAFVASLRKYYKRTGLLSEKQKIILTELSALCR
jgi:hypothetical protein